MYEGKVYIILGFLHKICSRSRFKNTRIYHNFAYHYTINYKLWSDYGHVDLLATYPTTTQLGLVCRLHFLALCVLELGLVSFYYTYVYCTYGKYTCIYINVLHLSFWLTKLHVFNQRLLAALGVRTTTVHSNDHGAYVTNITICFRVAATEGNYSHSSN